LGQNLPSLPVAGNDRIALKISHSKDLSPDGCREGLKSGAQRTLRQPVATGDS
jgi:hypothetical protein